METSERDDKKYLKIFHDSANPKPFNQRVAQRRALNIESIFSIIDISKENNKKITNSHIVKMTIMDLSSSGCAFETKYFIPLKKIIKM